MAVFGFLGLESLPPPGTWALWMASLALITAVSWISFNLFLHPLRHYPGPKLWAATHIPYIWFYVHAQVSPKIESLHDQYGDVVRVAPNRLSYTDPDAYRDIRGHRKPGEEENTKDPVFYMFSKQNILGASRDGHARLRKVLANGFSARSMQLQRPLITQYVDLFMERMREFTTTDDQGRKPAVVDMVAWFNFTTFDVIGDLAFGKPFGCLEESKIHPWVQTIFTAVPVFSTLIALGWQSRFAIPLLRMLIPSMIKSQTEQLSFARQCVEERLRLDTTRPDFIDSMVNAETKSGDKALSDEEMVSTARILVFAGSETTATSLAVAAFFLAKYPEVQKLLAEEVRTSFKSEEEIDLFSVQNLRYMLAVLEESMRMMPAVPANLPRVCQPGGSIICGRYVTGGTGLDIWPCAMFRSKSNFNNPKEFDVERWLQDETPNQKFANERPQAFQPFSVGPRNCIGKNLAYVEMRLILARLVWNYDMTFADDDAARWDEQCQVYNLWHKGPLNLRLMSVV